MGRCHFIYWFGDYRICAGPKSLATFEELSITALRIFGRTGYYSGQSRQWGWDPTFIPASNLSQIHGTKFYVCEVPRSTRSYSSISLSLLWYRGSAAQRQNFLRRYRREQSEETSMYDMYCRERREEERKRRARSSLYLHNLPCGEPGKPGKHRRQHMFLCTFHMKIRIAWKQYHIQLYIPSKFGEARDF